MNRIENHIPVFLYIFWMDIHCNIEFQALINDNQPGPKLGNITFSLKKLIKYF